MGRKAPALFSSPLLLILLIGVLSACKKEKIGPQSHSECFDTTGNGVFIINEGNFQSGNASLTFYQRKTGKVSHKVFKCSNERPLGDVAQSMTTFNGNRYLVVNNSSKIEVLSPSSLERITVIEDLSSPRYFLGINEKKAYVTDFSADAIHVIDLTEHQKTGTIGVQGWTEDLLKVNDKVFVCSVDRNEVLVIDPGSDRITDTIPVTKEPTSMVQDRDDRIHVLCSGGTNGEEAPAIHTISPQKETVEKTLVFSDSSQSPSELTTGPERAVLYYLNDGVFRMGQKASSLPASPFIEPNGANFYGLGVDPVNEHIYVSDAMDFVQPGRVYRYDPSGAPKDTFKVGVIPGAFSF